MPYVGLVPGKRKKVRNFYLINHLSLHGTYLILDLYALNGDKKGSISSLNEALKLGYDDFAHFSTDEMLASIKNEAGYKRVYRMLSE